MVRIPVLIISFILVFCSVTASQAVMAADKNLLMARLEQKMADAGRRESASLEGQERALICSYCHGGDGNSLKPDVPNLAGQNPQYLLEQIGRFARGERKDYVMNSLASQFTEEDQVNLAIYYSSQEVMAGKYSHALAVRGKGLYLQTCQACHGQKGMGNAGYARLAGQKPGYIETTLTRFRDTALNKAIHNKRHSPIMEPIASRLSDQDIRQLAAYLASLP